MGQADDVLVGLDEAVGGIASLRVEDGAHGREGDREPVGEPGRVLVGPQSLHQRLPRHRMPSPSDQDLQQLAGLAGLPLLHRYRLARPYHPEAAERLDAHRVARRGSDRPQQPGRDLGADPHAERPQAPLGLLDGGERTPDLPVHQGPARRFPGPRRPTRRGRACASALRASPSRLPMAAQIDAASRSRGSSPAGSGAARARSSSASAKPARSRRVPAAAAAAAAAADACSRSPAASATQPAASWASTHAMPGQPSAWAASSAARSGSSPASTLAEARQGRRRPWRSPDSSAKPMASS